MECGEVERVVFSFGFCGNGVREGEVSAGEEEDGDDVSGEKKVEEEGDEVGERERDGGVRLPSSSSSPPLKDLTSDNPRNSQVLGLQRAKNRELVRQAARRGVAFGFLFDGDGDGDGDGRRRKVEAVQGGRVVESSFAKGEWGVRWRER